MIPHHISWFNQASRLVHHRVSKVVWIQFRAWAVRANGARSVDKNDKGWALAKPETSAHRVKLDSDKLGNEAGDETGGLVEPYTHLVFHYALYCPLPIESCQRAVLGSVFSWLFEFDALILILSWKMKKYFDRKTKSWACSFVSAWFRGTAGESPLTSWTWEWRRGRDPAHRGSCRYLLGQSCCHFSYNARIGRIRKQRLNGAERFRELSGIFWQVNI